MPWPAPWANWPNCSRRWAEAVADPALGRFALLQLVRLSGTLIVLVGAMAASGNVRWLSAVPGWGAMALALVGLTLFFGAPRWLVRRWKRKA